MLKRVSLGAFLLFAFSAAADALPLSRLAFPSAAIEVRSLRAPCACRVRSVRRVVVARPVQKRTVIVGFTVTSREERPRKRRYDMPSIPKQPK